jgi:hypothetical protein
MVLKLKTRTMFPAYVTVQTPILLVKNGISYDFSVDMNALAASLAGISNTYTSNQLFAGTFGYGGTGTGGAVTQITSKSTTVVLSKACGAITLNNAALAAATIVSFVLTNTLIAATDVLILNHISGGTVGSYTLNAQCAAGSATINIRNNTAGSLSEAIVIQFALVKAVST